MPSGETCATAIPIPGAGTISGTTRGGQNNYEGCFPPYRGVNRVYRLTVPARTQANFKLDCTAFRDACVNARMALYVTDVVNGCDQPLTCIVHGNGFGAEAFSEVINDFPVQRDVFVFIDAVFATETDVDAGTSYDSAYDFNFTTTFTTLNDPPGNTCWDAQPAALPFDQSGLTLQGYSDEVTGHGTDCSLEPVQPVGRLDRHWAVTIPGNNYLRATLTPQVGSAFQGALLLSGAPATACDSDPWLGGGRPLDCLATSVNDQSREAGDLPRTLLFKNSGATPRDALLAVEGVDATVPFRLAVEAVPAPANDTCATPTPLMLETTCPNGGMFCAEVTGNVFLANDDYHDENTACGSNPGAFRMVDVVYSFQVPPGRMVIWGLEGGTADVVVAGALILGDDPEACQTTGSTRMCVGMNIRNAGGYMNPAANAQSLFLVVEAAALVNGSIVPFGADTPYTLRVRLE